MLTHLAGRALTALALVAAVLAAAPAPAYADYVWCPPHGGDCIVIVETPGGPGGPRGGGGGGGGGGSQECRDPEIGTMPCYIEGLGWFSSLNHCWWQVANPQPPAGHPDWQGHLPGDGAVYTVACGWPGLVGFINFWRATPPPGFGGGGPSPATLAARAINSMGLLGPAIGVAPDETGYGLTGLPVWLWTTVTPQTWGPISATASVPGLAVTARAKATLIVWNMGDGHTTVCHNPGTEYKERFGSTDSPTCGYRYTESSRTKAGGRFTLTAVTTWHVDWWVVGGGETGSLTVTRASTTSIEIRELEVVSG